MPDDVRPPRPAAGRGREADAPQQIPPSGWKDVAWRVWGALSETNIFLASGGVSYAVLLALFPGLAALVSVYGLVMNPQQIATQVDGLTGVLPGQTQQMLDQELHKLATASSGTLGAGVVIGLLLALWSASRGMSGLMTALDMAYEEKETRSIVRFNLVALLLTLGLIFGGILAIALIAGLPALAQFVTVGGVVRWLMLVVQWPVLMVAMLAMLAVLYRYGPDREEPQWRWISPGAVAATVLWVAGSALFTVYVANFSSYGETYGSLGGVVVLMTWFYLTAFSVLLGAVVNAQTERQTRRDTTTGAPRPMGGRGARAADTLGAAADPDRHD